MALPMPEKKPTKMEFVKIDGSQKDTFPTIEESANAPLYLGVRSKSYKAAGDDDDDNVSLRSFDRGAVFKKSFKALNSPLIAACFILPPLIFGCTSMVLTFSWHYKLRKWIWFCTLPGLLPTVYSFLVLQKARGNPFEQRKLALCTFLFFLAWAWACVAGEINYWIFMYPYYAVESLKTYANIDPAGVSGTRLMDAGQVHFAEKTRLATEMGMSYIDWDTYCVAPIVDSTVDAQATYDFWAVGINCCRPNDPHFECGEYNNPSARAGLRQLNDDRRASYALAVQQAEAAYNIQASHPTFFYWVQDPDQEAVTFFEEGFKSWILINSMHFTMNTILVFLALVSFSKAIVSEP